MIGDSTIRALVKTGSPSHDADVELEQREEDDFDGIRCPRCRWQPSAGDRWCCYRSDDSPEPPFSGCGAVWNTFATSGCCPGCSHQWHWTSCLRCHQWSPHDDWYEREE